MKLTKKVAIRHMTWVRRVMLWTSLIGLFASVYLTITYLTGAPIACGIVHGCDIVRASKWAYSFGIPRPLLGVAFYLAIIFLLVIRVYAPKHRPLFWTSLTILAASVGFLESGFLTFLQWYEIKAYCLWCLMSAVAATLLFILCFFEGEEDLERRLAIRELKVIFISFLVAILVGAFGLWLLLAKPTGGSLPQLKANDTPVDVQALIFPPGTPSEGSTSATVKVVEFVDLQCPVCRAFEPIMQKIRQEYATRITFAFRTFMLPELHQYAKESAIAAQCAGKQGKFIAYVDAGILNQDHLQRQDLIGYADALHLDTKAFEACLDDPAVAQLVTDERKAGEQLGVDQTPSIFMNTTLIKGAGTYDQIKQALDEELKAVAAHPS